MGLLFYGSLFIISILIIICIRAFYVPKQFQHLKKVDFIKLIQYTVNNKSIVEKYEDLYRPKLNEQGYTIVWQTGEWNLVVSDYKMIKEIMHNTSVFQKNPKVQKDYGQLNYKVFGTSNIVFSDKDEWKHHRRAVNPAFKKAWNLNVFVESGYELIEKIEQEPSKVLMMHNIFQRLTLDVLGRGLFSYEFFALKNGDKDENLKYYNKAMKGIFDVLYIIFPFLNRFNHLIPSRKVALENAEGYNKFLQSIIENKRKEVMNGIVKDDIVSLMVENSLKGDEDHLTTEEIQHNLAIFFVAGHDTTANTLTSTLYFLAKYQEIQDKARAELLSVVGENNDIQVPNHEQQKELKYLNCVIKESMRFSPTISMIRRHTTKDITLSDGTEIKNGNLVNVLVYFHHRNPEIFPDPETFNPDRFQDTHNEQNNAWMPFGMGTRICIGLQFSLIEQRVILAMLLQKYEIKLGPNCKLWDKPKFNSSGFIHIDQADILFVPRI